MKVLFTVNTYYPLKDGISIVVQYLAEGLVKSGFNVTVLTLHREEEDTYCCRNGVEIKRLRISENVFKKASGEIELFYKEILDKKYDIIINEHIDSVLTNLTIPVIDNIDARKYLHLHGMAGIRRGLFSRQDSFFHYLGNIYHYFRGKKYYNYAPYFLKKYNSIICLSEYDESFSYLKEKKIDKVSILGNACDDSFFNVEYNESVLQKYGLPKQYLVSIANYNHRKNQIGILKAFLKTSSFEFTMVFIGSIENKYYEKLVNYYKNHSDGVHKAIFLTGVKREDIPQITQSAYLSLQLSSWEGYSISLVESMASGVPFISSATGNAKELPGGVIVKDFNEMSKQIDSLILDKNRYDNFSLKAKIYAEKYCKKEKRVKELIDIITE